MLERVGGKFLFMLFFIYLFEIRRDLFVMFSSFATSFFFSSSSYMLKYQCSAMHSFESIALFPAF